MTKVTIVCENDELEATVFKMDRYWYHSIKFKDRRIGPRSSHWYFTKGDALKSLKSMPRVKKCLEKKKQKK